MQPGYPQQPAVDNNMTMSIVAIFFFWPLAIPAIMSASKVSPLLQQGDYAGAAQAASDSKRWSKLALIIGIVIWAVLLLCCILGAVLNIGLFATSNSLSQ